MKYKIKEKVIKPLCIYSLAFSMLLPSVASLADLDINLGGYSVVQAASIEAPTITKAFIGTNTISGGNLHRGKINGENARGTVHVTLKDSSGNEKATVSVTPKSGTTWTVNLVDGVTIAEGDTVTAYQEFDGQQSTVATANATDSLAKQNKDNLKMPKGEIWIEDISSNLVNDDEQAEAVKMLKDANTAIAGDIESVKFSIDGIEHAYYEVTYTDGSTSGKVEATSLKIKTVTETSATPTIEKVQVTDGQIIVTLAKEVAAGTKFYFVKNFTDGEDKNFCKNGSCKVYKSNSQEMPQAVSVDGTKVIFQINAADDLELGKEFGIIIKEPHKFSSCAKSEPVITSPAKVEVRDPHRLTDDDKKAIDKAIRGANTVNGKSKLPDSLEGTDYPAFIDFDKDGNARIIDPNNVEGDWDWSSDDGIFVPKKNDDGTYIVKDESQVIKIPAKDLVKNIKPDAPTVALSGDKKNITITPNEKDTDASKIEVTYIGKDGKSKTTTATKADDGTWYIAGEGTVLNGVITFPKDKVKGGTDVTATVTDKGGIADDDKYPLTSDPGNLKIISKAEQINELGGLDPEVMKKWVGDEVNWKDGVKSKDDTKKDEVNKLLKGATFTDETETKRSTEKSGEFLGKIKVKFDDGSELTVENQKLMVCDHVTSTTDPKLPKDALDVQFKLGEGVKVEYKDPNSGEVTKTTKGDKDNPVLYKEYKVKPGTDFSNYKHPTLQKTIFELIDEKVDEGYTDPVWTSQNGTNFVAASDNNVFTATATKTFNVTVQANGGIGDDKVETKKSGEKYTLPKGNTFTPPENQEFAGWLVGDATTTTESGTEITITSDTVIKASWKPIEIKVKFQTEAGASGTMEDKTVNKGSKYELPKPTFTAEEGKEFAGWKVPGEAKVKKAGDEIDISGDVTLIATWKDIEYKVIFNGTEGKGSMPEKQVKKGEEYTLPENGFEAPKDKVFDGWMVGTEKKSVGDTITINGDTEVKAIWKVVTPEPENEEFIVSFNANGGKGTMDSKTVKKGETYELPANGFTAPEGKEFDGWNIGFNKYTVGAEITVTDNITVIAQWKDKAGTDPTPNTNPGEQDPNKPGTTPGEDKPNKPQDPSHEEEFIPEIRHKDYTPTYPVYTVVPKTEKVEKVEEVPVSLETHKAYIVGYEDDTLRAEGNLTRAEAAAMVTRLAGLDLSDNTMPKFKDMQKNAWYFRYINAAVKANMLDADNGMMRPNDKITRAEFAKMLAAIDKENSSVSKFEDIKGHRYEKEINKIYGNNRIEGYEDGSFRPDAKLTRAESAAFLNRMFNRIADKEAYAGLEESLAKFKDFDDSKWYYDEMVEATNSHELTRRGKASDKYGRVYEKWTRVLGNDVK